MALARTNRLQATSAGGFGTGAFTTSSFTPSSSSLLVVRVSAIETGDNGMEGTDLTISDSLGTLTWTSRVHNTTSPGWSYGDRVWTAPITTGASMTVSIDCGTHDIWFYRVEVFDYTGYDTGSPVGATAAGTDADGDGAGNITLSGAPASTSEVLAFVHTVPSNSGSLAISPGAGWTELFEDSVTDYGAVQSQARSGSTSTSVDWADLQTGAALMAGAGMVALEIKEAGGGGGGGVPKTSKLTLLGVG